MIGTGETKPWGFMDIPFAIEKVGTGVDIIGVLVVVVGIVYASIRYLTATRQPDSYKTYRQNLGRGILLGLEILVAGDIIRTVAVAPTMNSVLVLGMIVMIRTFLSWSLEVELEGMWPWQSRTKQTSG
jgi:uncharacterized membrane protein